MKRKTKTKPQRNGHRKTVTKKRIVYKTPKVDLPFNLRHPDLASHTELAFECKGKKFYRMAHEFRMPTGRYKFLDAYLLEHELRMTPKMFNDYLDKIEFDLNGKGGTINLTRIAITIHNMRTHANLLFVPDTIKKLASVVYFDDTEDLRDYDPEYGKKKIALWETDDQYSFFLTRPIVELLNLEGISVTSLQTYMDQAQIVLEELTLDQSKPSSASS
jgi:hypothetical protein